MSNYFPDGLCQDFLDPTLHNLQQPYLLRPVPRLCISTPEQPQSWNSSQRARSVQDTRDQVYSPATSVNTAQTTPDTLISDRGVYHQPYRTRTNNGINFSQQNSPYMITPYVSPTFNPSPREEPWSSLHMRNAENRRVRCPSRQSNAEFSQYRYPRVGSDIDSSVLPSDSSYTSLGTNQSLLGNEPDHAAPPLTTEFVNQMESMNVESAAGSVTAGSYVPSDQRSHIGSTRSRKSTSTPMKCDHTGCNHTFKCYSEYKKHKLRHDKPFKCNEPECKRALEGFTTKNDLDRHRKSVHQVGVRNKSYKCVGKNCRNKEKVWPRLDNFKQHVKQMHPQECMEDVIERSKLDSEKQPSFVDDESAVAHMGASLVLDGMEKSLPSYPAMASSSPLEPPLKRDQQDRSSFDWSSDAVKEEHKKPHFPDATSSVTQSTHQEQRHAQRRAPGLSLANQTQIPLPSDNSLDLPPSRAISQAPQSNKGYGLSNAPQTKAEQQRMARTRSVAMPSPTGPADIGHILNMLQQADDSVKQENKLAGKASGISSGSDAVILSKRQASELVEFLKAAQAAPCRTGRGIAPRQRICPHPECGHTVTRECDMRKHLKRHERPYGCTYPNCYKRFGAKSDWKRHENNQHFQPEAYRCAFEISPGAVCGTHSHRLEMFEIHIKQHIITSSQVLKDLTKHSKIGKNCQETFWCGLCKAIIPLKTRRNAAWDERFDHIAHHLEKEKKSIEEWVCVEQNRTKKELEEEKNRDTRAAEDDKDKGDESESVGEDEDGDSPLLQAPAMPPPQAPMTWTPVPQPQPSPLSFSPESSRKRGSPSDTDHTHQRSKQKRRRTYTSTYCCSCDVGPFGSMQASCLNCGHVLCDNCNVFNEEFMMGSMELYG